MRELAFFCFFIMFVIPLCSSAPHDWQFADMEWPANRGIKTKIGDNNAKLNVCQIFPHPIFFIYCHHNQTQEQLLFIFLSFFL
ncbi:hypothetical protein VNO77_00323 [Canavalia gladiata]|uniref:Secreted protein n=1 Tax=Canavalia gladiata TaxID=3824 RepID=A0AAN9MPU5_CANGL